MRFGIFSLKEASAKLEAKAFFGIAQFAALIGLALFLTAGTVDYAEGWVFLGVFFACAAAVTVFLVRTDPLLLARRLDAGPSAEQRPQQKLIQALASAAFVTAVVVPAVDHRLSWSHVPLALVALGDGLVALGFLVVFFVFRENTFASAVIEVGEGQRVIDTGPYAYVRHPMYAGALVMLAGIPLALGSYWGLVTLIPFVAILVLRLLDEEALLSKELPGYGAYQKKVRYRLVPHIW